MEPDNWFLYTGETEYPKGVKVWVDGQDISTFVFNKDKVDTDITMREWNDIDISVWCRVPGRHTLTVTSETPGRVETRVEIR